MDKDAISTLIDKHEHIETAARALKAIAHPLRLKILCVLGGGEECVQDIVDAVGTSQSNISQHLAILRDKGILASRKDEPGAGRVGRIHRKLSRAIPP